MNVNLSKLWEIVKDREVWHVAVHGVTKIRHDLAIENKVCPLVNLQLSISANWHFSYHVMCPPEKWSTAFYILA